MDKNTIRKSSDIFKDNSHKSLKSFKIFFLESRYDNFWQSYTLLNIIYFLEDKLSEPLIFCVVYIYVPLTPEWRLGL